MLLSKAEADAITVRSAQLESRVGVQVIAAIIGKADAHVELPWKAFALGAVLSRAGGGGRRPGTAAMAYRECRPGRHGNHPGHRCRERIAGGLRSRLRAILSALDPARR